MNSIALKILIVAVHFEVTGARYITDAFKRLGHDVKHVGPSARLKDVWGVDVPEKYVWTPDIPPFGYTPDLIVLADTIIKPEHLGNLMLPPVPHIYWSNDNHVRNVRGDGIDHYFLAHKHGQAQPVIHADETWLPCAADTSVFVPSQIQWEQKEFDVCCIGVLYPHRLEVIEALKAAGLKVYANTGDVYDEYRAIYQNSRISLCLSANDDLAQRVFETGAMGCLIAMDIPADIRDEETATALGITGYIQLNSAAQAVAQITEMLTIEKELAKFGAASWQKVVLARHDWTHRAQVVIDWYEDNYGDTRRELEDRRDTFYIDDMTKGQGVTIESKEQKPYLNLGCGKTHLPSAPPPGHEAVDKFIYEYPLWINVDKVQDVGADKVFDLFTYPWPLEDNSYDGALLAHIVEHIPHEIKTWGFWGWRNVDGNITRAEREALRDKQELWHNERVEFLEAIQDGWYAFFSELYRVLTPGAIVHIVSPYGFSDGGITDPTHHRYLTANTFTHSMKPAADGSTFQYNNGGIHFEVEGDIMYRFTPMAELLMQRTGFGVPMLMNVYNNVCYDFYVRLKVVK